MLTSKKGGVLVRVPGAPPDPAARGPYRGPLVLIGDTVKSLEEIEKIESRYTGADRRPVLQEAYDALLERWSNLARDRETALRLLFLGWYSAAEANFLTGLDIENPDPALFRNLISSLGAEQTSDPEVMFVVSTMTAIGAEWFGDESLWWTKLGARFREKLSEDKFRIRPEIFEGRGAYGQYFAHQARFQAEFHGSKTH